MTNERISDAKKKIISALNTASTNRFWEGTISERKQNFRYLHIYITNIVFPEMAGMALNMNNISHWYRNWHASGESNYNTMNNTITLNGRLSMITYLHEIGHAIEEIGMSQSKAQEFAISIFKEAYPKKFEILSKLHDGGMFIKEV